MNHNRSRPVFRTARPLLALLLLELAGCHTYTGVVMSGDGIASTRVEAASEMLPSGAIDLRIAPLDTLTVDVHRSSDGMEVADLEDAIRVAFSLREELYRVAPGDALGLTVESESPQEFTLIVRSDGFLTLPRIGEDIAVAGKTLSQIARIATEKFSASSTRPQIAVQLVRSVNDQLTRLNASYEVSREGTIVIPTLGSVFVLGLTGEQIGQQVQRLAQSVHRNAIAVSATIDVAAANATVMQSPEIRRYYRETVKVSADGSVYLPTGGRFDAAGKTLAELTTEVAAKLRPKYRNGLDVYIGLSDSTNMAVYVMGEVRQPGRLAYQATMTMLQVLATAGWLNDSGDLTRVKMIHRTGPKNVVVYTANLKEVYADRNKDKDRGYQDLRLSPGDMVMVPRTGIADADLAVDYYIRKLLPFNTSISYSFINGRQVNVP